MTVRPGGAGALASVVCAGLFCGLPAFATSTPEFGPGLSSSQRAQLLALQSAHNHGLVPGDYEVATLESLASDPSAAGTARFTERLDSAYNRYSQDISHGRLSALVDPDWHIPQRPVSDEESGLPPPHADYERLHEAMIRYQAIGKRGGWADTPAGPKLSVGMLHSQAAIARNRLRLTADYDAMAPANVHLFDSGLDAAVRRFQARHGLRIHGVIDDATREAMNVSVEDRIEQLAIAMERWRWLPREFGDQYVWVNAAQATLNFVIDGSPVLSMRTIVGHSTRPTPSLQSEIRRVVFNPTWSVPYTIATEDLLPRLDKDREFLSRNGFRVYTGWRDDVREVDPSVVDWSTVDPDHFPYRFIQQPGPGNSLGRVKIVFNNPYDIYIHDTPSKGLFGLRTRTFSSGCVRLEQATDFVDALIANDQNWSTVDTQRFLDAGRTRGVNLHRRVPIYVVYITSWVSEDGRTHFRRDLYRRDAAVRQAFNDAGLPGGG